MGGERGEHSILPPAYGFTGQQWMLYDYNARYYNPAIERFVHQHNPGGGTANSRYYSHNGVRLAVRREGYPSNNGLFWLLTDHLGGTAVTLDATGNYRTELRYLPYGKDRYNSGGQVTVYRYTGQVTDYGTGLYWYRSRWYDPYIGRFLQPDTIVPDPAEPQDLNRYAYTRNNPLRYTDPSGHYILLEGEPGTPTEFAMRETTSGAWIILRGGLYLPTRKQVAAANYLLTGRRGYLHRLPPADRYNPAIWIPAAAAIGYGVRLGRVEVALERRGQENRLSQVLGLLGVTADIVDFSITAGFAGAYTLEQALAAATGPAGAATGFMVGETAYRYTQVGLLGVDMAGWLAVFAADRRAARTGADLASREISIGVDTLASSLSLAVSNTPLPVIPGVYMGLLGDTGQITYDFMRLSGRLPGYSLVVRWR